MNKPEGYKMQNMNSKKIALLGLLLAHAVSVQALDVPEFLRLSVITNCLKQKVFRPFVSFGSFVETWVTDQFSWVKKSQLKDISEKNDAERRVIKEQLPKLISQAVEPKFALLNAGIENKFDRLRKDTAQNVEKVRQEIESLQNSLAGLRENVDELGTGCEVSISEVKSGILQRHELSQENVAGQFAGMQCQIVKGDKRVQGLEDKVLGEINNQNKEINKYYEAASKPMSYRQEEALQQSQQILSSLVLIDDTSYVD